jgi:transposase InsO family protein
VVSRIENKSKALDYLHIPKSTFYYKSILDTKDELLRDRIYEVLVYNPSYGHRRIAMELDINHKRTNRVMKKYGIVPIRKRRKPFKRANKGELGGSPNLLVALTPLYKNHVWITDFTYLKWRNRWVYVCTVIDLYTREVLGISIKTCHDSILVGEALLNALNNNHKPLIVHSDQGSEYRSVLYRSILNDYSINQSMSKKGSPWQNGYQESFFSNWKLDIGDINVFKGLGELTAIIYRSIYYYNHLRIHTAFGMSPRKFTQSLPREKE